MTTIGHGLDAVTGDQLIAAAGLMVDTQFGAITMLQRKLGIGFAQACRVMDVLESVGIIGASAQAGQARPVLISPQNRDTAIARMRAYITAQDVTT